MNGHQVRVVICIATCGRPELLADLLRSLGGLQVSLDDSLALALVVVDNDAGASAGPTVEALRASLPWPLVYDVEPRRSIAHARNRAVRNALALGADFVAFVDDDEVVPADWVAQLLQAQRAHDADVVCGPVLPSYEVGTPPWIVESGLFEPKRYPSGTRLSFGITGNALVASRWVAGAVPPFSPSLGMSGGEDVQFFGRIGRSGARIVWADEAEVREWVPRSRASVGWLLRRAFRVGGNQVRILRVDGRRGAMLLTLPAALLRVTGGLALLMVAALRGRGRAVRAMQTVMHGLGAIAALAGLRYDEYRTIHGR